MHPFSELVSPADFKLTEAQLPKTEPIWSELHAFLAVARVGSAARAAQTIGVSRATIAQQIQRLQDRLGMQLLSFTATGALLTTEGRRLASVLGEVDQRLFEVIASIRPLRQRLEGKVKLSITDGLAFIFITPLLRQFSDLYPLIQIHLMNVSDYVTPMKNDADVAIAFAPDSQKEITCTKLGRLHYVPFCSDEYIKRHGNPHANSIGCHLFVDTDRYSSKGGPWAPWHSLVSCGRTAHLCESSVNYGLMVKAGLGIGLLPTYAMSDPAMIPLPHLADPISIRLYVVSPSRRLRAKPVKVVYDYVTRLLGSENPWLGDHVRLVREAGATPVGFQMLFNLPA